MAVPQPGTDVFAPLHFAPVDVRMISLMRLALAASALLIIYIDPAEPDRLVAVTYAALVLYTIYSALLYVVALRRLALLPLRITHWLDVGCYLVLISLSSGTSSVFFFFFAILVASFRWGFAEGLRVTLVSAALFTVIGYATAPHGANFELNRFLLRPIYLLVLGYMMAYWGGLELSLKRRLALLREVNRLSNPRFGVAQTIASIMDYVRAFFRADACVLVLKGSGPDVHYLRRADTRHPEGGIHAELIAPELARQLLALPDSQEVIYQPVSSRLRRADTQAYAYDQERNGPAPAPLETCALLAELLEADAFLSAPLCLRGRLAGRLFLTAHAPVFKTADLEFVRQLVEQVIALVENVQLLDRLASKAAERERKRISHDLHDSTIQPYIGLRMGLEATRRQVAADAPLAAQLDALIKQANDGINDLRRYVRGLSGASQPQEDALLSAVRRQAAKFNELYGIAVEVQTGAEFHIAAEAFQIVCEGLSNIRRHTNTQHATIKLLCDDRHLHVTIINNGAVHNASSFMPRSITTRAEALGGTANVIQRDCKTTVAVRIPL